MQVLRSALDFLGGPGPVLLAIGLLFATPVIDRLFVRRKRVGFRVLYNSKIGLGPEQLHDGTDPNSPQLRELVRVLDRMSIVVIRIRNTGNYDIDGEDFDKPLTFTFGDRVVWNARVSEAGSEQMKAEIRRSLQFFGTETGPTEAAPVRASLPTVRERMAQRVARWGGLAVAADPPGEPVWHGVRLEKLALRRKQKFKLLVVLREPDSNPAGELGKDVKVVGDLGGAGIVHDERPERLITLPRLTGGLAALLAAVLVLVLAWPPSSNDETVACASGTLKVVGSSVFMPTMATIAGQYEKACPDATITTSATGSIQGVREVVDGGEDLLALSDGKQDVQGVFAQQLAIVVYHVVVHSSVGLDSITVEQLRGIYAGVYTDWSQLRGGSSLPIRVVGRGGESGTRELFEQRVLGGSESALSSNDCRVKDRAPDAPVIRCERDKNADVVREIGAVEGAIGYADAPSVAEARKTNALVALSLGGKVFDAAAGVEAGYPFWTVEYLYTRSQPAGDSLAGRFLAYVREHDAARVRMKDAGYLPCLTADGVPLDLCNLR
ncbi:PstS family phosphate ABC transporter substrate-binding protein [Saccharothrix sp. ALI-22-I]|uniref:PstS family phosphate ABC transporter substrate-binding protein n=1 Tax=Saccharothrix sp. ALI-22-I TaxID=1933778 RepID=UPI001EE71CDA|nr:substrate-binding domain-containing protein [Saccharothrix sp. ALI-22-I]